jgi:ParB family chromosome partitioning protein
MTTAVAEPPATTTRTKNAAFEKLDEAYGRIPIGQLVPSKTNPRQHFDETYLAQLAESIAEKGLLEPILVRPLAGHHQRYEIIAGECRYRASKIANETHLPAVIRRYTDEQALEVQLIENLHRQDLAPLEQARGFRALIDSNPTKHSAESIATRIGMSPAWVWDRMKLLDLVKDAQEILSQGRMTVGHAIQQTIGALELEAV